MDNSQNNFDSQLPRLAPHPRFGPLSRTAKILLMVVMHILLALAMQRFEFLSTFHAILIFAVGVYVALTAKDIKKVIPIAGYITGAEVLWRMTGANIFWEYGKYATIAILVIALLKERKVNRLGLPAILFILLIPSIILTIGDFGMTKLARSAISFNLSGWLTASVCIFFFYQVEASLDDLRAWVWPTVYPILGILALAAYSTLTATSINFTSESNIITSGGFGPNQVSAILGLGALLLTLLAIQEKKIGLRFWELLFSLALLTQSLLTFSRGGPLNYVIALVAALVHLLTKPTNFIKTVFIVFFIALVVGLMIFPQLEEFTGGLLSERFSDLDPAIRAELARADLQLFLENPFMGVGPGLSSYRRSITYLRGQQRIAAHTEYTRLLAEHGSAGVLALIILLIILGRAYFKTPDVFTRAWVVALAAWSLVEMSHAAMRVVSISFILGLAVVGWQLSNKPRKKAQPSRFNR